MAVGSMAFASACAISGDENLDSPALACPVPTAKATYTRNKRRTAVRSFWPGIEKEGRHVPQKQNHLSPSPEARKTRFGGLNQWSADPKISDLHSLRPAVPTSGTEEGMLSETTWGGGPG